ncbi:head GIN domain-containing protein [Sphingomonas sp. LY29]|uniref:head GIN domain-containing protein n=1 Tax=Sphingomonas sp. LY29 TaxID=3095341 RepID=UPI002D7885A7|nr:head GIN domain-containing protein [Sphingomonas sp. LY29]WRP24750.1 head GIN domain-containing protein [Sphingomonas sp. LY29]
MLRFIAVAAVALTTAACHYSADAEDRDPGPKVDRTYQVGSFDKIQVAGPYDIKVVSGGAPGITASGGSALLDETDVIVENGTLKIIPKKRKGVRFNWTRDGGATFTVNAAALRGASIAGSGDIVIDRVAGDFEGEVAGSGNLAIAAATGGKMKLAIAGSGDVRAAGNVDSVDISIAGSGGVDAAGLATKVADVSIAGSGNVRARASDTADVSIMGSGDVELTGGAKCNVSKHGSGDVRCS